MSVKVTFMAGTVPTRTFDGAEDWGFNEVRHLFIYDSKNVADKKIIAEIVAGVQSVEFV